MAVGLVSASFTLTPGAAKVGTIDLSPISSFDIKLLAKIIDQTTGLVMYDPEHGINYAAFNAGTNVLTFEKDTSFCHNGDNIQVYYELGTGGGGGGGGGAVTVANGADVTQGAKADAADPSTDTTPISIVSILKQISKYLGAALKVGFTSSATGTQSIVPSANTDTVILAANSSRKGATIYNDSTANLLLLLANAVSSATVWTVKIPPDGYYELPADGYVYTGAIKGIWSAVNGNARVTELT